MPKEGKGKKGPALRHDPLEKQLREDDPQYLVQKKRKQKSRTTEREVEAYVAADLTRNILAQATELQIEVEAENADLDNPQDALGPPRMRSGRNAGAGGSGSTSTSGGGNGGGNVNWGGLPGAGAGVFVHDSDEESEGFWDEQESYMNGMDDLDEGDLAVLGMLMPDQVPGGSEGVFGGGQQTLADLIDVKFAEHAEAKARGNMTERELVAASLNPRVVEVYTEVGAILSKYRAGKLPKAFKIIPGLQNWEDILYLTDPTSWTPHAMYAATKVFASNLNAKMAQRFYNLVLLPCVCEDIEENKRLNYHLYMSLKKALYKPAAFFKGIVLPLAEGYCTLRQAIIIGSVLKKVSIPMLHSASAMLKMADMDYNGATTIFLAVLIDKKYSLPKRVVIALVNFFVKFGFRRDINLPVLWHKCLLVFVQRYRTFIKDDQRDMLRELLKVHQHYLITPEIQRQLFSRARGECRIVDSATGVTTSTTAASNNEVPQSSNVDMTQAAT